MEYLATAILQLIGLIASGIVEFFTGDFWENLTIVEVVKPKAKGGNLADILMIFCRVLLPLRLPLW